MFEGIVANYPKRSDLWSVFLDQELKTGDEDRTRQLFERIITLDLKPRQVRFFFKRYLAFEHDVGTKDTIEGVKAKARAYVESRLE
mmetsp:Transcript_25686/g.55661  ORF Transcript_25686/g.55661 Transcript_25686/m.55661 type:complete len:86 (+) Transcript_25686:165-422(+)